MSQPQQPELGVILAAYQNQSQSLVLNLALYIARLWLAQGAYRNAQMASFTDQAVPAVVGAQQKMSALTAASLAAQEQAVLGSRFRPVSVDQAKVTGSASRNGTSLTEVYGRPFHTVWRSLDNLPRKPGSIDQAIKSGLDQAVVEAKTDLQRAKQLTAQQVLEPARNVTGYRRVLEGEHSCGLCIVAATRRYHKAELLPIHPGCDCSVEPIFANGSPVVDAAVRVNGQLVPVGSLPDVHDRIEQRFGTSNVRARTIPGATDANGRVLLYRDALITHTHGELGPVLGVRSGKFLGPSDLK